MAHRTIAEVLKHISKNNLSRTADALLHEKEKEVPKSVIFAEQKIASYLRRHPNIDKIELYNLMPNNINQWAFTTAWGRLRKAGVIVSVGSFNRKGQYKIKQK